MKAYSEELREKVIEASERGGGWAREADTVPSGRAALLEEAPGPRPEIDQRARSVFIVSSWCTDGVGGVDPTG